MRARSLALSIGLAIFLAQFCAHARPGALPLPNDDATTRLQIELTGGDQNKPVSDASVYVKFVEERKLRKDKHIELNLKTNQEGVARSPELPRGKILLQIVAPGWKTYGEYHDLTEAEQTIRVHLERPKTKWY